jgi:hypothetical protein
MGTVVLNLAGLQRAAAQAQPPPPPPKKVINLQGLGSALAAQANAPPPTALQSAQTLASVQAREAVYKASGADRTNPPPDVHAAAENAAAAAAAQVAALQADPNNPSGNLSGSLAIDTTTGNVSFATLEHKIQALPPAAKLGLAIGGAFLLKKFVF